MRENRPSGCMSSEGWHVQQETNLPGKKSEPRKWGRAKREIRMLRATWRGLDVAWTKWCDTGRRKGETTGNTNVDLNRRVSPRPTLPYAALFFARISSAKRLNR
jgi:hypothetical protein